MSSTHEDRPMNDFSDQPIADDDETFAADAATAPVAPVSERSPVTERVVVDRPPPEARPATWLAAIVVLVLVFAVGVVVGQSGGLGGLATSVASPAVRATAPTGSAVPPPSVEPVTEPPGVPTGQPSFAPGDFGVFWQALDKIRQNYVGRDELKDRDLTYGAIRGMVEALGDTGHSTFLTPEALASETQSLQGTVVGVGALLGTKDGHPVIVSVISGGPASRAGMHSGDAIISVNGTDVSTLAPEDVASQIRGEAGTTVVVKVARPSTGE